MLGEIKNARQIPNEGYRRWFRDQDFDLILWYPDENQQEIFGFQLCYDKAGTEKAITWTKEHGFRHNKIDDGEEPLSTKKTPILVADGTFDTKTVLDSFKKAASSVDTDIVKFIEETLRKYSA